MKRLISTSFSPNTQADDVWLALRLLVSPWRWINGSAARELSDAMAKALDMSYAFPFESGRTCLYRSLQALGVGTGDEVLLQAFTCVAVPAPICWTGATPIYVDCDAKTFTMDSEDFERKITSRSKAVIIQHTFGYPADLDRLCQIARRHKLVIIEDCAHAVGTTYQQRPVGSFGDISFFSFGRDKPLSSIFGGVVLTSHSEIAKKLEQDYNHSPSVRSRWVAQQLFHPILFTIALPLYTVAQIGKVLLAIAQRTRFLSRAVTREERQGRKPSFIGHKLPNALAELALHQWKKRDSYTKHRKHITLLYQEGLRKQGIGLPDWNDDICYLRYPIRVERSKQLLLEAKNEAILLGDWYTTAIAPEGTIVESVAYIPGSCPQAEREATQTVTLPTHINITPRDAQHIINFLISHV